MLNNSLVNCWFHYVPVDKNNVNIHICIGWTFLSSGRFSSYSHQMEAFSSVYTLTVVSCVLLPLTLPSRLSQADANSELCSDLSRPLHICPGSKPNLETRLWCVASEEFPCNSTACLNFGGTEWVNERGVIIGCIFVCSAVFSRA